MSRTDDAIASIKRMIVAGDLKPGDRLPRTRPRQAPRPVAQHASGGGAGALPHPRPRRPPRRRHVVTDLDPATLLETFTFLVDLHRTDNVLHFFHVRRRPYSSRKPRQSPPRR